MLEILKTHLRKKTVELAKKHGVENEQIKIIWHNNDFYYQVQHENGALNFKLSL